MTKVIICDLDGTLLRENGQPAPETVEIVRRFIDSGGIFMIATGRLDHDIVYIEEKLGVRGAYRISQNGAVIKNQANEIIWKQEIDVITAIEIVKMLNKKSPRVEISDADHRYFPTPRGTDEVGEFVDQSIVDSSFVAKIGKTIFPTILLTFGGNFENITQYIRANYGQMVDVIMTSPSTLEILSKGVSKGAALEKILQKLPMIGEVCAIGDSENDISMFEIADYAYAISTGKANVQQAADEVYPTVDDCIYAFMEK
ncbi:Cof-type HAD-IIB family hydrolase [Lentibacillus sp. L22]|uniref:Cof-type HAD-IIB family hydrolase n=1 Tax=Lentibacillus TaxID=175304 RepID=UPI0022B195B4|nr:Cof-type HAD-IIB family hydrolase [Lentibacillus daqui]